METFRRYWALVRGIKRSPVNSLKKSQWRGALMFSLICAWTNSRENIRGVGDLRRHRAHYDVTVMFRLEALTKSVSNSNIAKSRLHITFISIADFPYLAQGGGGHFVEEGSITLSWKKKKLWFGICSFRYNLSWLPMGGHWANFDRF